jgi:hypothetical protein
MKCTIVCWKWKLFAGDYMRLTFVLATMLLEVTLETAILNKWRSRRDIQFIYCDLWLIFGHN